MLLFSSFSTYLKSFSYISLLLNNHKHGNWKYEHEKENYFMTIIDKHILIYINELKCENICLEKDEKNDMFYIMNGHIWRSIYSSLTSSC
jgi:hypothetical protein